MARTTKFVKFRGRLVIVGFGSIGQGVLPLILRHIDMKANQVTIVTAEDRGQKEAKDLVLPRVEEAHDPRERRDACRGAFSGRETSSQAGELWRLGRHARAPVAERASCTAASTSAWTSCEGRSASTIFQRSGCAAASWA